MELKSNEQIQYDIGTNLKRGLESVGGKLKVTNERLYFKPHAINIKKKELELSMDSITNVKKSKSLGLIPNALTVVVDDGSEYKFVLGKSNEIMNYINSCLN
ncbi:GRAM domain-containing protein [Virgibacillus sp. JSM 102003]|uniref:GRAM domain-containing protein n=1 Tax=Virgibacillus sp. JSM 102003 TaxID=1562108 RepID=UPI0035BF03BB